MDMLRIGIIGASGYTGAELVRLLAAHPRARIVTATSESFAGRRLGDLYPGLGPAGDIVLAARQEMVWDARHLDAVFLAVPHGESHALVPGLVEAGLKVIDLSGDFRFPDPKVYETWYHRPHGAPAWADRAVYGLPELFRDDIRNAVLVANPGCYVTAAVLALYPFLRRGWIEPSGMVVDAKSGLTGAGRTPKPDTMFNRITENVVPYKAGGRHQHTPEIERALGRAAGREVTVTFTPHLIPARRGILSTVYGRLTRELSAAEAIAACRETYADEPFVDVRGEDAPWPDLRSAAGTNTCILAATVDPRTQTLVAAGSLDNLIKGASGQAIQNFNLLYGWDETLGLPRTGLEP